MNRFGGFFFIIFNKILAELNSCSIFFVDPPNAPWEVVMRVAPMYAKTVLIGGALCIELVNDCSNVPTQPAMLVRKSINATTAICLLAFRTNSNDSSPRKELAAHRRC